MKQPNSLFKLAAVVSSVLLVGGFISYRAGAFDWLMGTSARPANSTSDAKSGILFVEPAASQQAPRATAEPAPIIMGGSKSISIGPLINPPSPQTAGAPPPANPQPPAPSR